MHVGYFLSPKVAEVSSDWRGAFTLAGTHSRLSWWLSKGQREVTYHADGRQTHILTLRARPSHFTLVFRNLETSSQGQKLRQDILIVGSAGVLTCMYSDESATT